MKWSRSTSKHFNHCDPCGRRRDLCQHIEFPRKGIFQNYEKAIVIVQFRQGLFFKRSSANFS